jgi:serine/threonine-protein kinase
MIGRTVSHFKILESLGKGAMGHVFKAQDTKLDRFVALKFMPIHPETDEALTRRFIQEAKAASNLGHPNICAVHEIGETDEGHLFIAMSYCEGENLKKRTDRGPLPLKEAVEICIQVGEGLDYAHSQGIVHRDIKPSNLILARDGLVKIVDFGLAKLTADPTITSPGMMVGTLAYMSPEQARGEAIDRASDIWALGVLLYQLITGLLPFDGSSGHAIVTAILTSKPVPMSDLRPGVPKNLEQVITKALAKDTRERFSTAGDLVRQLRAILVQLERSERAGHVLDTSEQPSIAVLPFANMSSDTENEYFSDGLTEELINALSQLPDLRVVSRTSAFEFKGKNQNIRQIGERLNVSAVLEGSVRKAGNKLRITAQLIKVADDDHLWAGRFDREIKDVFEIQDEIAHTIATTLKVKLLAKREERLIKNYADNLEAYNLYLKGRYYWNKRSGEGFQKALEYFQAALTESPDFAPAYAGLADCYVEAANWGMTPASEAWPKAKELALKAVEIDPTLAEAYVPLGMARMIYEWDWPGAEREFVRALESNPGYGAAHMQYSMYLVATGRLAEAHREIRRALDLDPLSIPLNSYLAGFYYYSREYERSIEQCHKALELDSKDIELHVDLGLNYEQLARYEESINSFEMARDLSGGAPIILGVLGGVYAKSGARDKALAIEAQLTEIAKENYVPPGGWAMLYIGLGDNDKAFEWVEKACDNHDTVVCYLAVGPTYDPLRSDPRFQAMLKRIGLAEKSVNAASTISFPVIRQDSGK